MNRNTSLQALRKKLKTAEKRLQRLKDNRPDGDSTKIRKSDTGCRTYMNELYKQIEKTDNLRKAVEAAEKNPAKRGRPRKEKTMEQTALEIVALELGKAKGKHPEFPNGNADGLCIISEEIGELAQAINDDEAKERLIEEAAHVAATAIRFIEKRLG